MLPAPADPVTPPTPTGSTHQAHAEGKAIRLHCHPPNLKSHRFLHQGLRRQDRSGPSHARPGASRLKSLLPQGLLAGCAPWPTVKRLLLGVKRPTQLREPCEWGGPRGEAGLEPVFPTPHLWGSSWSWSPSPSSHPACGSPLCDALRVAGGRDTHTPTQPGVHGCRPHWISSPTQWT